MMYFSLYYLIGCICMSVLFYNDGWKKGEDLTCGMCFLGLLISWIWPIFITQSFFDIIIIKGKKQ